MQAIVVNQVGPAEGLAFTEIPNLTCGHGQVLIAVEAAGVGLVDVLMRQGYLGAVAPGYIPGLEVAGRVTAAGAGVDPEVVGTRVYARGAGGYAQHFVARAADIVELPEAVSATTAVALGINALVARFSLIRGGVRRGEKVLVRGASGGVGALVAQMAVRMGAEVTAITNESSAESVRALGVPHVIRRGIDPLPTGPFDVIIDPVAGAAVPGLIGALAPNGRYVINGAAGGMPPEDAGQSLVAHFSRSPTYGMFSLDSVPAGEVAAVTSEIFAEAARGELDGFVAREFALQDAIEAHKMLEAGPRFGKVVLRP